MTGIDPDRLKRRLHWAAEQLGLAPDAKPDEVRSAWLQRLPKDDFVPSSELRWALASLLPQADGKGTAQADREAALAEEERLRGAVEAFTREFWDLSSEVRRRRWTELRAQCASHPALDGWLRLLEAGLGSVPFPDEAEDERVVELARQVRTLFVLRPEARTRARQAFLHRSDVGSSWKPAVKRLRHNWPALASLEPGLLDKVVTPRPKPPRPPKSAPVAAPTEKKSTSPWVLVGVVLVVVSGVLRTFNSSDKGRMPPVPPLNRPWDVKNEDFKKRMDELMKKMKEQEDLLKPKPEIDDEILQLLQDLDKGKRGEVPKTKDGKSP